MKRVKAKSNRFLLLVSSRGDLTCVEPSNIDLMHKYEDWEVLAQINRSLSLKLADYSKRWAVRNYWL